MGYKIRQHDADGIYLVGNRTLQARFFLTPSREVNEIILGLLAYYADLYEIEIFGFVFMSNHFHMIVRARLLNLKDFMRDLQSGLARKLNRHWGRTGTFFCGRYSDPRLLDDAIVLEKLCYTVCNPCLSNLVSHPKLWPGLSSWDTHASGQPLVGKRVDSQEYWRLRRKYPQMSEAEAAKKATTEYELHLAKLPMWEDLDDEAYHDKVLEHVEDYALEVAKERRVPCLGPEKVCAQHFTDRPKEPKSSPRPLCLAIDPEVRDTFKADYREVVDRYKEAAGALRRGRRDVEFPYGTIPPGHLRCVGSRDAPAALPRVG